MKAIYCECCGGDCALLGVLGDLAHFRCVQCGWDQSVAVEDLDAEMLEATLAII